MPVASVSSFGLKVKPLKLSILLSTLLLIKPVLMSWIESSLAKSSAIEGESAVNPVSFCIFFILSCNLTSSKDNLLMIGTFLL